MLSYPGLKPATAIVREFDEWIRTRFIELNTKLEELYFVQENRASVHGVGETDKTQLVAEGKDFIVRLLREGTTGADIARRFDLLGNVGFYMAACRRHDLTEPSRETRSPLAEASVLALQLGTSLGVAPRFTTSHLQIRNYSSDGAYKCFTSLEAERVFTNYNTRGQLAYMRAADALIRILPLGISHPVACDLLVTAEQALHDVARFNDELYEKLDVDRFFYCVRPYFKPYRVGIHEYRGANAGDFAGINEIDLLLGLCRTDDLSYAQLLCDKMPYLSPDEQKRLAECVPRQSFLDTLLEQLELSGSKAWFRKNTAAFLRTCEAHGVAAAQHHDKLVRKFITEPSQRLPEENLKDITASGPPLSVLLSALEKLSARRQATKRDDFPSRYEDLRKLRAHVESTS